MSAAQIAQARLQLGHRSPLIPPPGVQKHGFSNGATFERVEHVLDVWTLTNGHGAHYPGATAWSHLRISNEPDPIMWFQQWLMLSVEATECGSSRPNVSPKTNPKRYKKVLEAAARVQIGASEKGDKELCERHIISDYFWSPSFNADLEIAKEEAREKLRKKKQQKSGGGGGGSGGSSATPQNQMPEEPEELRELRFLFENMENIQQEIRNDPDPDIANGLRDNGTFMQLRVTNCREEERDWAIQTDALELLGWTELLEEMDEETRKNGPPRPPNPDYQRFLELDEAYSRACALAEGEAEVDGDDDDDEDEYGLQNMILGNDGENVDPDELCNKVSVCVIPVPKAGYCVRFIIHDPTWDPTYVFQTVFKINANTSNNDSGGASRYRRNYGPKQPSWYINHKSMTHGKHHPTSRQSCLALMRRMFEKAYDNLGQLDDAARSHIFDMVAKRAQYADPKHPFSLYNLFSPTNAARVFANQTQVEDQSLVDMLGSSFDASTGIVRMDDALDVYTYKSSQVFWYHPNKIGWQGHMFVDVNLENDFISALIQNTGIERFLDKTRDDAKARDEAIQSAHNRINQLYHLIADSEQIDRSTLSSFSDIDYLTYNEYVHAAARADKIRRAVSKDYPKHAFETLERVQHYIAAFGKQHWRSMVPADGGLLAERKAKYAALWGPTYHTMLPAHTDFQDFDDPELQSHMGEYERYCEIYHKAEDCLMETFQTLWLIDGDVGSLPVPPSDKTAMEWGINAVFSKEDTMSRLFIVEDPEIGILGNSTIANISSLADVFQLAQPCATMLTEGALTAWRWAPDEMNFNLRVGGKGEVGKTYHFITVLRKCIWIPGIIEEVNERTDASDTTSEPVYDCPLVSDEAPMWETSEKEGLKHVGKVDREKNKITRKRISTNRATYITVDGQKVLVQDKYETDHHFARIICTNHQLDSNNPLATRNFDFIMTPSRIPIHHLQGDVDVIELDEWKMYWRKAQYLNICTQKALQCGAILSKVNLDLWKRSNSRIMDYLQGKKYVRHDVGNRPIELMKPFLIMVIIRRAVHCVFDMPQSKWYEVPFSLKAIPDMAPHLYVTLEDIYYVWTLLGSKYVNTNKTIAVKAIFKSLGFSLNQLENIYELYAKDMLGLLPFKQIDNPNWTTARSSDDTHSEPDDKYLIDLNYFTIRGSQAQITENVAGFCELSKVDLEGIFKALREDSVEISENGVRPQPKGSCARWHKYTQLPTLDAPDGMKQTGIIMPEVYRINNPDYNAFRTATDLPRYPSGHRIPIMAFPPFNAKKDEMYISLHALAETSKTAIREALDYAFVSSHMPLGKIVIGTLYEGCQQIFDVVETTEESKEQQVEVYDAIQGWRRDEAGNVVFDGDARMMRYVVPSRTTGIAFIRTGASSPQRQESLRTTSRSLSAKRRRATHSASASRQSKYTVIKDLDAWSAMRQHVKCGRPLDEPVQTQKYVLAELERTTRANGTYDETFLDKNYPDDWYGEYEDKRQFREAPMRALAASMVNDPMQKLREIRRHKRLRDVIRISRQHTGLNTHTDKERELHRSAQRILNRQQEKRQKQTHAPAQQQQQLTEAQQIMSSMLEDSE